MPVELDLLHSIKETQLQHGLRAENYSRYHAYLTNRVATLRRQLKLSNDKKKFLHRDVTAANATDSRHLMLLALYAERCWAEAESQSELLSNIKRQEASGNSANKTVPPGGVPPAQQYRKRLNKAVQWAQKLSDVASVVADPRTQTETKGYLAEVTGRCAVSHGRFAIARDAFKEARNHYMTLEAQSTEAQWPIVLAKVGELDDRVVYCMDCLGEDASTYRPQQSGGSTQFAVTVRWNRRTLSIFNVKVKDTLREVQQCDWAGVKQKAVDVEGPIPVGTQAKVLDTLDRCIGLYNDALGHARTDLRSASDSQRQELQLLVHYLTYHVSLLSLSRTRFMLEVFERRYRATVEAIRTTTSSSTVKGGKGKEFSPTQYASPLEVVRLCDTALETIGEMCLLPGVSGGDEVEAWENEVKSIKLYYAAEGNRIVGDASTAAQQYARSKALSEGASSSSELRQRNDEGLVTLAAEAVLKQGQSTTGTSAAKWLVDALDIPVVASSVTKFPPDFQAVACKPVFVDIAATYIDYPGLSTAPAPTDKTSNTTSETTTEPAPASTATGGKPWGWGWGWGKK